MLLSPTKRLFIVICPEQIAIVQRSGGWRRRSLTQTVLSVPRENNEKAVWQHVLEVLASWLEAEGLKGCSAAVIVSNRWVRFAIAPWSITVNNEVEEIELARACLESTYGDLSEWDVTLGPARYGQTRIVCAMESAFLDRLRSLLHERRIVCRSVYPYFMLSMHPARELLSGSASLLAVAESGSVVLASARQGRLQSLRSIRSELSPATLVQLLEREALLQGFGETPLFGALAPGMTQTDLPGVTMLRPQIAASSAQAMALEAVNSPGRMPVDFVSNAWSQGKIFGVFALLIALGATAGSTWQYLQLQENLDTWQADWQRLSRSEAKPHAASTPEDQERMKAELRFANLVIEKLDTPWGSLFDAVESAFSDDATLLSVEPDTERQEVRLLAEAKNIPSMLDYVQQVRKSPVLRQAYLADHQIDMQDMQRPVRFTVMARWAADQSEKPGELAIKPVPVQKKDAKDAKAGKAKKIEKPSGAPAMVPSSMLNPALMRGFRR